MFILSRKACFLARTSPNTFSGCILHKRNRSQNFNFWPKPWTNQLEKCQFFRSLKPIFLLVRKACLLYKTTKIVFSRFMFTIYDMGIQGVTSRSRGLQRVKRSYKGLWGVTKGYKGLQGVTRGYKVWQGVTRRYRGLQRIIETFF